MVLRSVSTLALGVSLGLGALLLAAGCKEQSLFDEGKDEGPGSVGSSCPSQCLGDAARDFDGTISGAGGHWRYLDDHRDRTWTRMEVTGGRMQGEDAISAISSCVSRPAAPACSKLPKALLISSAGSASAADPAIEFKFDTKQTVQVGVRAFVPDGADLQQILVYRNSREDLIYGGPALPGDLFERSLDVDVIPGDRLLFAVAPAAGGATEVGFELFLSNTGTPSRCQVAIDFEQATGDTVVAHCGDPFAFYQYEASEPNGPSDVPKPPILLAGPYPELGQAASIPTNHYFKGTNVLDKGEEFTWQYWMHLNALVDGYGAWVVSDMDLDIYGGMANVVYEGATVNFDTQVGDESPYLGANAEFQFVNKWVFVRVSYTNGKLSTCLDGKRLTSLDVPVEKLKSNRPLYLGKNVVWSPQVAAYNGLLDDVRVLSTALPCQ